MGKADWLPDEGLAVINLQLCETDANKQQAKCYQLTATVHHCVRDNSGNLIILVYFDNIGKS
jgi:hypothetical protein